MTDKFASFQPGLSDVATRHFAITPSDSTDLAIKPRSLYCSAAGNAVIRDEGGVDITYPLSEGQVLPFRGVRILSTGTTATVVGWY